jgi:hypothetical protein
LFKYDGCTFKVKIIFNVNSSNSFVGHATTNSTSAITNICLDNEIRPSAHSNDDPHVYV